MLLPPDAVSPTSDAAPSPSSAADARSPAGFGSGGKPWTSHTQLGLHGGDLGLRATPPPGDVSPGPPSRQQEQQQQGQQAQNSPNVETGADGSPDEPAAGEPVAQAAEPQPPRSAAAGLAGTKRQSPHVTEGAGEEWGGSRERERRPSEGLGFSSVPKKRRS